QQEGGIVGILHTNGVKPSVPIVEIEGLTRASDATRTHRCHVLKAAPVLPFDRTEKSQGRRQIIPCAQCDLVGKDELSCRVGGNRRSGQQARRRREWPVYIDANRRSVT